MHVVTDEISVTITVSPETAALLTSVLGGVVDRTPSQGLSRLYDTLVSEGVRDFNTDEVRWLAVEENEDFVDTFFGDQQYFIVAE